MPENPREPSLLSPEGQKRAQEALDEAAKLLDDDIPYEATNYLVQADSVERRTHKRIFDWEDYLHGSADRRIT